MSKCIGIKIVDSDGTHIFLEADYPTEEEYNKAWLALTQGNSKLDKWYTADPIMEEEP